ncbi:MAG TPA: hypothetical protein VFR78_05680, partial [Pyrinomonadaceae bacterium]|nr:hypothetical protein [Pyrinomonadaceae bacterium]
QALIVVAVAIALVAWFFLWFRNEGAVEIAVARPWPGEMGSLEAVENRWPALDASEASAKFTALAKALPENKAVDDFVEREIARGELTIGDPPALPDVNAIRELLLREPVVWESRAEFDDTVFAELRGGQMRAARALVASALTKARARDVAAWDDLHAAWKLARSLEDHRQMMAQTAVLTITRMINAVAWKMPLPAPEWLNELQDHDNVPRLLEAFQYQVASYSTDSTWFPTKWLANSVDRDRGIAESLFKETRCDVNTPMNDLGTDLSSVWRRAFRARAEREATANALRVRTGKSIETGSRCSDGGWTFDGTTLRFSREIPTAPPDKPMPLVLQVK